MYSLDNFVSKGGILVDEPNMYRAHEDITVAQFVCENDSQCIGIYDAGCDQEGPFSLVKKGLVTSASAADCIFKKKRYNL